MSGWQAHGILLRMLALLCLVVLIILLTGCGVEETDVDFEDWNGDYDFTSPSGIFVLNTYRSKPPPEEISEQVDHHYQDVQECTNIYWPANHPFKRLAVHFDELENLPPRHQGYHIGTAFHDYVRVNGSQMTLLMPWVLRHEYVHVLLWRSGASKEMNTGHGSPLFSKCEPIDWR